MRNTLLIYGLGARKRGIDSIKIVAPLIGLILLLSLCACTSSQPEGSEAEETQAPTWQEQYDLGVRYLSEGNYEAAILAFTAAIEIGPKQASAYVGRGDAYVMSGETEDNLAAALTDYEKAIELDEASVEAYLGLADVYIRQGDYEKALEVLREGLEKAGDDQSIQSKISEIEDTHAPDVINENPLVALMQKGDGGHLPHADEVTFFGYDPSSVSLGDAEQILGKNGFYCEYMEDGDLMGGKKKTEYGLYGPLAILSKSDDSNKLRSFFLSAQLVGRLENENYGPINVGLRGICTEDSPETVFAKLGFTNAAEVSDFMCALSDEKRVELRKDLYYYNGNFGVEDTVSTQKGEWEFDVFLSKGNKRLYHISFRFLRVSDAGGYLLDSVFCYIGD